MQQIIETQQQIMAQNLGEQRAAYKSSPAHFIILLITSIIVSIMIFYMYSMVARSTSSSAISSLAIIFVITVGILFGVTLFQIRDLNIHVFVHEQGLLYQRSGTTRVIRWDQIAFVWHQAIRNRSSISHQYKLQCLDGSTLTFRNAIPKVMDLGKTIEQETARVQIPSIRDAFSSGQSLAFGQLLVQQSGLTWRGNMLPWQELQSFTINEDTGIITIKKHNQWLRWAAIQTGKIPNIEVLKTLIKPYAEI